MIRSVKRCGWRWASDWSERSISCLTTSGLVVLLYDVHGYAYEEIAQIADISLGTVKSRLSRARAHLRDTLKADKESRELFEAVGRHLSDDDATADSPSRWHGKAEQAE